MADTISGVGEAEKKESQDTAVSSEISAQNDKPRTKKTSALTQEQALEILQQSILNCKAAGIDARVAPLYQHGARSVIVVLANVEILGGRLEACHE